MTVRSILRGCILFTATVLTGTADATTYYVAPGGNDGNTGTSWTAARQTIQGGVDVATVAGDVVVVSNGTYNITNEITLSTAITLRSANGAATTIVRRSGGNTRIFSISADATLDGFTVQEGTVGGIFMSAGTVRNCVIAGNSGPNCGGVRLQVQGSTPVLVEDCIITNNQNTTGDGGGVVCYSWGGSGSATIRNNLIAYNSANQNGGGIAMDKGMIENCTIVSNSAGWWYRGSGVRISGVIASITNSIIYYGAATFTGPPYDLFGFIDYVGYSCSPDLTNGLKGNITANPLFKDPGSGDYHLTGSSPCVNTGSNAAWMSAATDLAGLRRISSGRVDMGAYESLGIMGTVFCIH